MADDEDLEATELPLGWVVRGEVMVATDGAGDPGPALGRMAIGFSGH